MIRRLLRAIWRWVDRIAPKRGPKWEWVSYELAEPVELEAGRCVAVMRFELRRDDHGTPGALIAGGLTFEKLGERVSEEMALENQEGGDDETR